MGGGTVRARRRWELVLAGVVGLLVAGVCWTLTASLWEPGQSATDRATVLGPLFNVLSLALGSISIWLTLRGLRSGLDLDRVARDLAGAVRVQRQRFVDQALAVAWTARPARVGFRDPEAAELPEPVETLLLHWQDTAGADAGTIHDVAAFYQQQPTGRLVVLGAPGAGKTVLLSRLVLDLLDEIEASATTGDLPPRTPIPVLLSLPSCDLGDPQGLSSDQLADRLQEWITHRLIEDYHLRPAQADALVRARRVLPVLDGLDEMDPAPPENTTGTADRPRARAVLRALNAPDRPPVVLACRQLDYHEISQPATDQHGGVAILTDARHVMLRPLEATDIASYLTERFHGRDGWLRPRWQPVADALHARAPLLPVLANPWQLFLAVTAYTAENSEPAELLTMSPGQVETHLLANLIPAVTEHNDTATRHGWTGERITRWLTTIADHQYRTATEHGSSPIDIYLPELWRVANRRYPRWVPAILAAIPFLTIGGWLLTTDLVGRIFGVLALLFAAFVGFGAFDSASRMQRLDLAAVRTPRGRRRRRNKLAVWLAVWLAFGLAVWLVNGLVSWPVFSLASGLVFWLVGGLVFWLVGGLVSGLGGDVHTVPSVTALTRQCLSYSLASGLAVGLAVGLTVGLVDLLTSGPTTGLVLGGQESGWVDMRTFMLVGGLAYGVPLGLAVGLTYGHGNVWLRYVLGVRSAARQGTLPRRPARFLDWCLDTGLMRMAGNAIQFRHRQLQDWLTTDPRRSPCAATVTTS